MIRGILFNDLVQKSNAMEIVIMILTFICTYALVALILFVFARLIFPSVEDVEDARQLKSRVNANVKRYSGGTV